MAGSAFLALALTGRLDAASIVIFLLGLVVSFFRTLRHQPPLIGPRLAFILSCVYILVFLFDMTVLSGSFIPATVHLVLFLELVKFFQEKTDRDYVYLIVLAFLKVLAAAALTVDSSFALTLLLFLVTLVSTLMSFDILRSERRFSAQRTASGAGYVGSMSVWATVWIVAVGAAVFFAIPRLGAEYFTRAAAPQMVVSGFSEKVRLGQIGRIKLGAAPVMHARRIGGAAGAIFKWRGIALDHFDGQTWSKTDMRHKRIPTTARALDGSVDPLATTQYIVQPFDGAGEVARYQVLLEPLQDANALFGPFLIRGINGSSRSLLAVDRDNDDSVYMRASGARVQYEVISEIPRMLRAGAAERPATADPVDPRYLQLPENIDPQVRRLALEITGASSSDLEKAVRVEAYLKRNYTYSLDLDWDPGEQPVSTFLFSARRGHCEYFASSMALLLRAAGVGTRIVNGFLMGEYNAVGDHYLVRQSDAHSWIEAYIPGLGWREFDPTPPDPHRGEMSFGGRVSQYLDAMEMFWNTYVLIYDTNAQMQLFRSAQEQALSLQAAFRDAADHSMVWLQDWARRITRGFARSIGSGWFYAFVLAAIAAVLIVPRRRALLAELRMRRLRRGTGAPSPDILEYMFYRAAELARGKTPGRSPAQTWREWIVDLPDTHRRLSLERAAGVFERLKYGGTAPSSADFVLLDETLRELARKN